MTVFNKGTTNFLITQQNKENIYLSYQHYFLTNVSNFLNVYVGSKKNVCIFANILQSILKQNYCNLKQKKRLNEESLISVICWCLYLIF